MVETSALLLIVETSRQRSRLPRGNHHVQVCRIVEATPGSGVKTAPNERQFENEGVKISTLAVPHGIGVAERYGVNVGLHAVMKSLHSGRLCCTASKVSSFFLVRASLKLTVKLTSGKLVCNGGMKDRVQYWRK